MGMRIANIKRKIRELSRKYEEKWVVNPQPAV
jgi:hypothetical protein